MEIIFLVVGVVLGVILDRTWRRFEQQPQFHLQCGIFDNIEQECGLVYTVTNVGASEIPEYDLTIFHPERGSLLVFNSKDSGPLLPGQKRMHYAVQTKSGKVTDIIQHFFSYIDDKPVEHFSEEGFLFRIRLARSEKVLFESEKIGRALAKAFDHTIETTQAGLVDPYDASTSQPEGLIKG